MVLALELGEEAARALVVQEDRVGEGVLVVDGVLGGQEGVVQVVVLLVLLVGEGQEGEGVGEEEEGVKGGRGVKEVVVDKAVGPVEEFVVVVGGGWEEGLG